MSNDLISANIFSADLLSQLGGLDEDSPLRKIDTTEQQLTFLPRLSVNMSNQWIMKTKDGNVKLPDNEWNSVIHHFHPDMHRIKYLRPFDAKNPAAPDCGSNNNISPDPTAAHPQNPRCDTCQHKLDRSCKLKQRVIISQKVEGGEPQLMYIDLNVTSVLDTSGEVDGWFGFKRYSQMVAKVEKNIYQFVTAVRIDPDPESRCKVQFKAVGAISDPEDPNLLAHVKYKEKIDFTEYCKVDFSPWGTDKDDESTVDKPAPSATLNVNADEKLDNTKASTDDIKVSNADVKEFLSKK